MARLLGGEQVQRSLELGALTRAGVLAKGRTLSFI